MYRRKKEDPANMRVVVRKLQYELHVAAVIVIRFIVATIELQ